VAEAYLYDAVRTPFGKYGGALAKVRPDDLAAHVVTELLARNAELDPAEIDEVIFGDANQAGEDNRDVARMAILLAGLPTSVPGTTVNRLCGSSLDAAMAASRMIETGDARVVLVGGVESMSRAPGILLKPERAFPSTSMTVHSSTLGWRIVNPKMPSQWSISLGESTEKLVGIHQVSREDQDAFAARSHRLTAQAWDGGFYDNWVIAVPGTELARDESLRPDSSPEKLATLKPAFVAGGSVTAGNASPLNDGAGALLIGDSTLPGEPLARIVSRGMHAVDPDIFGIAPVEAANQALARWPELDPDRVNPNGGAIAIGHPLGASGARILAGLAYELRQRGGGYGVAAICIGVGQGLAVVLEV
jgi:acetyl-CoA acetyltransferase family protein